MRFLTKMWLTVYNATEMARMEANRCPACATPLERTDDGWAVCPRREKGSTRQFRLRPAARDGSDMVKWIGRVRADIRDYGAPGTPVVEYREVLV